MTPEFSGQSEQGVSAERLSLGQLPDADLWHSLLLGSRGALGELYDRHSPLVYGVGLKVLGSPQEAEDLTQDIFINLSKRSYDPARGSLRTFLMILTRSRAIDRVRSRQSVSRSKRKWRTDVLPDTPSLSTDDMAQAEQSAAVSSALSQLSDSEQRVLRLAYYEGLSQAEIAQRLDEPLGTIKSRARRGLLKLKRFLQAQGEV